MFCGDVELFLATRAANITSRETKIQAIIILLNKSVPPFFFFWNVKEAQFEVDVQIAG